MRKCKICNINEVMEGCDICKECYSEIDSDG